MGKRALGIYLMLVILFTGMMCRVYVLSIGETLASAANTQSAYVLDVDRTRGLIYDCKLRSMVSTENRTVAAIQPSPEALAAMTEAIREDGEELAFDPQAEKPYLVTLKKSDIYSKGVEMFDVKNRYSKDQLAPHIIGYLNPEKDAGAAGMELAFDDVLKQYDGSLRLRYTLDAVGRTMPSTAPEILQDNYSSTGGIVLTLDADIQRAVQKAMRNVQKGAAVVMDVNTGDVKASVSMPAYNPNDLAASLKNPDSPFVNRAFSQFNVGSTFKLVVAAAALENGFGRYTPYNCQGYIDVDGHIFYCHWRNGHGEIDMKKAIEVSCNPFFVDLGLTVGGKKIASMAREIGFTRAAHFTDDIVTQKGTLPTAEELSNNAAIANLSFGQGRLTATPIQIAQMICTSVNGGYAVTPRLVEGFTDNGETIYERTTSYAPNRVFSKRTSDILREFMVGNMTDGSGEDVQPKYVTAGGKTASAQTGIYKTPGDEESEIVHAWFAGYTSAENPQYAIVVLVEDGGSGSEAAGPIFREIADAIYLTQL